MTKAWPTTKPQGICTALWTAKCDKLNLLSLMDLARPARLFKKKSVKLKPSSTQPPTANASLKHQLNRSLTSSKRLKWSLDILMILKKSGLKLKLKPLMQLRPWLKSSNRTMTFCSSSLISTRCLSICRFTRWVTWSQRSTQRPNSILSCPKSTSKIPFRRLCLERQPLNLKVWPILSTLPLSKNIRSTLPSSP